MLLQKPLAVVTSAVDGDILRVLASADRAFTTGELARLVPDRSIDGIRRAAVRLAEQGIVDATWSGRVATYALNREHLSAPGIIELADARATLLRRLGEVTGEWPTPPIFGAVFGSAGRGTMRVDSDIDIFLLRDESTEADAWEAGLVDLTHRVTRWTGNDTRIIDESLADLAATPLMRTIAEEGIPFRGSRDGFRSALRERQLVGEA